MFPSLYCGSVYSPVSCDSERLSPPGPLWSCEAGELWPAWLPLCSEDVFWTTFAPSFTEFESPGTGDPFLRPRLVRLQLSHHSLSLAAQDVSFASTCTGWRVLVAPLIVAMSSSLVPVTCSIRVKFNGGVCKAGFGSNASLRDLVDRNDFCPLDPSHCAPLSSVLSWHGVPAANNMCPHAFALSATWSNCSSVICVKSPNFVSLGRLVSVTSIGSCMISEVKAFALTFSWRSACVTAPMPSQRLNTATVC